MVMEMYVNFMQLLKAYSAFNNGGVAVTPKIASLISDSFGKSYSINFDVPFLNSCSKDVANMIHSVLIDVVQKGTGKEADMLG